MFRLAPSLSASARSVAARRAAGVPQAGARRAYSADADATGDALLKAREATKDHAGHSAELWRKVRFSLSGLLHCCPGITRRRGDVVCADERAQSKSLTSPLALVAASSTAPGVLQIT